MDYLAELNPAQRQAIEHSEGPLLIIAGAGAGKTKTLTCRVLHLIKKGVAPEQILAITFTNKAAQEMRNRVHRLLAPNFETAPFIATFHALGVQLLKENARRLGLPRYFNILDKEDSLRLVKQAMRDEGLETKQFEPRKILAAISRTKGQAINWKEYREAAGGQFFPQLVSRVWRRYEDQLRTESALDFDDLLLKTVDLLRTAPELCLVYQNRWVYLHIDEYQDTNTVQYHLARLLTGPQRHICVVGDIDQAIYGWRGADYRNILRFEADYPEARVITLEENYRSTKTILAAANAVIEKNRARKPKNLFTQKGTGEPITLLVGLDETEEAQLVAEQCRSLLSNDIPPSEIALLYRANFQSRALEEAMLHAGLPYQVLGTRFFERQEIKDLLAFLKVALNPEDIGSAKRVINLPPRGIGKATMAKIFTAGPVGMASLPPKILKRVRDFQGVIADIRAAISQQKTSDLIKYALRRSGLEKVLKDEGTEEGLERLANLHELVSLALKYDAAPAGEGVERLLTEAALVSDQDRLDQIRPDKKPGISLMTAHAAKGLEFKVVFITGLEQNLFPSSHFSTERDEAQSEERDEEEERRLFYVALTRAKEKLFLTYAQTRTIFGARQTTAPSEFLGDIPATLLASEQRWIRINF